MSGLGLDRSGNGNNWQENSITSTDQMLDTPTNNFATWNPLFMNGVNTGDSSNNLTLKEGNLQQDFDDTSVVSPTLNISSGKGYFEVYWKTDSTYGIQPGWINDEYTGSSTGRHRFYYRTTSSEIYRYSDGSSSSVSATYGAGDIIQFAWDMDSGKCWLGRNNTWYDSSIGTTGNPSTGANPVFTLTSSQLEGLIPHIHAEWGTSEIVANFGQDSSFAGNKTAQGNQDGGGIGDFYYTPPSGFLALCTKNLPDPAVIPSEHFNVITRAGSNSSSAITGVGFQPDFIWTKVRSSVDSHILYDAVRGSDYLSSDTTGSETNTVQITSYDSDGFTYPGNKGTINRSGQTYVDWCWKANGAGGTGHTQGTISSTASVNADAGFSIVSYTGNGSAGATVGHGLSSAPEMIIVKRRSTTGHWFTYHSGNTTAPETDRMLLNTVNSTDDDVVYWNDTAPTNSVFTVGTSADINGSGSTHISYTFHSVDGYSKVGSYTGNGSSDGTFVYTGFRPKYVMIKVTSTTDSWYIYDTERETYNAMDTPIQADTSGAEATSAARTLDIVSNGFKLIGTDASVNGSGHNYIFLAFAESPFKFSNAK